MDNDPAGFHLDTNKRHFSLKSIDLEDDTCGFEVTVMNAEGKIQLNFPHENYIAEFALSSCSKTKQVKDC